MVSSSSPPCQQEKKWQAIKIERVGEEIFGPAMLPYQRDASECHDKELNQNTMGGSYCHSGYVTRLKLNLPTITTDCSHKDYTH